MPGMEDIRFPKRYSGGGKPPRRALTYAAGFFAVAILLFAGGVYIKNRFAAPQPLSGATSEAGALRRSLEAFNALKKPLSALTFFRDLESATARLPELFLNNKGEEMLTLIKNLRDKIAALEDVLTKKDGPGGYIASGDILRSVRNSREFLDAFIGWADRPESRRIIIVFANTSELRPGGGFTGSFAEVNLKKGALETMTVHDINEPDRGLAANIVPPKPLQAITARWRAADANWFFDFPQSAEETLGMLERSSFTPPGRRYDGLISVAPAVLKDLLHATGPVTLPSGQVIDENNFLTAIQAEVQAGQADKNDNPKAILGELAPELLRRLAAPGSGDWTKDAAKWIEERDLMVYLRDPVLEKKTAEWGADGGAFPLAAGGFVGDYAAVVNANIGGGKSDFATANSLDFKSYIGSDGFVEDRLAYTREHRGGGKDEWWYAVDNWDYLQIFAPAGAELSDFSGGGVRNISPKADYRRGFETDADVAALEATGRVSDKFTGLTTFKEPGKAVFATWLRIPEGESRTLRAAYSRRLPHPLAPGEKYVFVYEFQQGAAAAVRIEINAPQGMVWAESGKNAFVFEKERAAGRLEFNLTPAKPQ